MASVCFDSPPFRFLTIIPIGVVATPADPRSLVLVSLVFANCHEADFAVWQCILQIGYRDWRNGNVINPDA